MTCGSDKHSPQPLLRPELLAPAGSVDVVKAVIEAGCDSVYVSGKRFGMRQHGNWLNFTPEHLSETVAYAHARGVAVYVTVNNLMTDEELARAREFLLFLAELRVDALIVQDLGTLAIARELELPMPLHASTMLNVHNADAARRLARLGVTRIVTSRDISIADAAAIKRDSGVEVEYFLHNDMCASQGSICYLSGIATENSANRGKCMKPCRWQWCLVDRASGQALSQADAAYLLAQKDMCLYHQIPELVTAGIDALKVEGRARKAEYLVPIISAYRHAVDRYLRAPTAYATDFDAYRRLVDNRIRDFTTSHAFKDPGYTGKEQSGRREPHCFSVVVEERSLEHADHDAFAAGPDTVAGRPEIAVRCQDTDSARAALANGADRVYVGGEFFNKNGTAACGPDAVASLIAAARAAGHHTGVALPRLLTAREANETAALLAAVPAPDEILVPNLGALEFAWRRWPSIPIVADFSFNVFNAQAVHFLAGQGAARVTLSPETPWPQLVEIAAAADVPLECLVHGGIAGMLLESCLISAVAGRCTKQDPCPGYCSRTGFALRDLLGKDRWLCADQYCRNHLLMEKDVCLLGVLDRVAAQNIAVCRIEAQYYDSAEAVGTLVALYRKYLDRAVAGNSGAFRVTPEDWRRLRAVSPRDLGYGAYTNDMVSVMEACEQLPTDEVIVYSAELPPA